MLPTAAPHPYGAAPVRSEANPGTASHWAKRLGIAAFLFFLAKGLAWLVVPAAVVYWASR